MLNKLQFNNLVISNKKGIQQARTQTINKLVHKIRKLKTLLEKHPDNTKCKERVRKSTETMEWLKKIKRVDIMKNVLLMDKPPAAIITNGLATPDEVGAALLAMNKVMQVLLKRFKTELKLDDKENDKWKDELRETSKRRQKIEKTEEKKKKRLDMKTQKAIGRNRQEWLEQNQQEGDEGEQEKLDPDANVSTVGKWQVEELEKDENEAVVSKKEERKQVQSLKRPQKDKPLVKKKEIPNKKAKKEVDLIHEATEIENLPSTNEEVLEVSQNTVSDEESEAESVGDLAEVNDDQKEDSEEELEETLVVDPFFITDTGENYLSTAVIKRGQNTENENSEDKKDLHMIKLNSNKKPNDSRERRQKDMRPQNFRDRNNQGKEKYPQQRNKWNNDDNRHQKYQQNKSDKQNDRYNKFQQNKWNNNRDSNSKITSRDNYNKNQRGSHTAGEKAEQNLHPSWAAKQKLKPVITGFQGKKITFGEDGNNSDKINSSQPRITSAKNHIPKASNSEKDSLHPSWAAKQKLKPTITAFQGKKITFGNDD